MQIKSPCYITIYSSAFITINEKSLGPHWNLSWLLSLWFAHHYWPGKKSGSKTQSWLCDTCHHAWQAAYRSRTGGRRRITKNSSTSFKDQQNGNKELFSNWSAAIEFSARANELNSENWQEDAKEHRAKWRNTARGIGRWTAAGCCTHRSNFSKKKKLKSKAHLKHKNIVAFMFSFSFYLSTFLFAKPISGVSFHFSSWKWARTVQVTADQVYHLISDSSLRYHL